MNCHTIREGLHHIHFCVSDGSDDCHSIQSDNEQSFTNKSKIIEPFCKVCRSIKMTFFNQKPFHLKKEFREQKGLPHYDQDEVPLSIKIAFIPLPPSTQRYTNNTHLKTTIIIAITSFHYPIFFFLISITQF